MGQVNLQIASKSDLVEKALSRLEWNSLLNAIEVGLDGVDPLHQDALAGLVARLRGL